MCGWIMFFVLSKDQLYRDWTHRVYLTILLIFWRTGSKYFENISFYIFRASTSNNDIKQNHDENSISMGTFLWKLTEWSGFQYVLNLNKKRTKHVRCALASHTIRKKCKIDYGLMMIHTDKQENSLDSKTDKLLVIYSLHAFLYIHVSGEE